MTTKSLQVVKWKDKFFILKILSNKDYCFHGSKLPTITLDFDGTIVDSEGRWSICTLKHLTQFSRFFVVTNNSRLNLDKIKNQFYKSNLALIDVIGTQHYASIIYKYAISISNNCVFETTKEAQSFITSYELPFKIDLPDFHKKLINESSGIVFRGITNYPITSEKKLSTRKDLLYIYLNNDKKVDSCSKINGVRKMLGDESFGSGARHLFLCKSMPIMGIITRKFFNYHKISQDALIHIGDNKKTDKEFANLLKIPFLLTTASEFATFLKNSSSIYKTTSLAFLVYKNQLLLQLRDDKVNIANPNSWGLFGGSLNEGETPICGLKREIYEETGININELDMQIKHRKVILHCDLNNHNSMIENIFFIESQRFDLQGFKLSEGQDFCLASLSSLKNSEYLYSAKTKRYHLLPIFVQALINEYFEYA